MAMYVSEGVLISFSLKHTRIHAQIHLYALPLFKQMQMKNKKDTTVSVSFPVRQQQFHPLEGSLCLSGSGRSTRIHQNISILFNSKTFIYMLVFSLSPAWDSPLHFALISASLPPRSQVYTADGSPWSWRNVSGETAHTLAAESCDRGMLFMRNSLKVR